MSDDRTGGQTTIAAGYTDHLGRAVTLREPGDGWRAVADVAPRDEQRRFVAALAARYLLLGVLEDDWHPLGIHADGDVVGHVMWGVDDDGSHWIGGLVIDAAHQRAGLGRAATRTLVEWLAGQPGCWAVRLSYHPDNVAAARLYDDLGFTPTGMVEGDELVVEHRVG